MIAIKCRILYTTIIDIILLIYIKKKKQQQKHTCSMHIIQSSQKKNINSFWQIKEQTYK